MEEKYKILISFLKTLVETEGLFIQSEKLKLILKVMGEEVE